MIKIAAHLILTMSVMTSSLHAQSRLEQAQVKFHAGSYSEALKLYEDALASTTDDPDLYYNAGSTALRMGDYALAILYLEKSLRYDPSDVDAQVNLAIAKQKAGPDYITPPHSALRNLWNRSRSAFSSNQWSMLALLFLYFLFGFWFWNRASERKIAPGIFYLLAIALLFSFYFSWDSFAYAKNTNRVVLMAEKPKVRLSTQEEITLLRGQTAKVIREEENQQSVLLPNGQEAIVNTADVERI